MTTNRRELLACSGALFAALAGCLGDNGSDPDEWSKLPTIRRVRTFINRDHRYMRTHSILRPR